MLSSLMSQLHHRKIILGKDIHIITMDWLDNGRASPGIYCIRQDWKKMFRLASAWALTPKPQRIQNLVPTQLIYHGGSSTGSR
jgi:DNA-binding LacI/PurR family transcriptional regulator